MSFNSNNFICIHMNRFKDLDEFITLLEDNDLDTKIDPNVLLDMKNEGYLKVWFDRETFETIAWTVHPYKRVLCMNYEYTQFLKDSKSITIKHNKAPKKDDFVLNKILDKIAEKGIDSLSSKEKSFLDKFSE